MPEKIHLTRSDIKQYGMSPVGVVTPMYIGQYCITDDNKVYFAKGLTSNDWIEASGSGGAVEDLNSLQTNNKSSLVGAINELFQNVDSGKQLIATAIDNESITKDSTFTAMGEAISNIRELIPNPTKESKEKLYDMMIDENYEVNESMPINDLLDLITISCINPNDIDYVSCGAYHIVLLKKDGTLWGAGYNGNGQLGLGDNTNRNVFTQIEIDNIKQVYCGGYHTFILKNDNTLWACGYNSSGQLGLGDTTNRNVFTRVTTNVENVKEVYCGYEHTMMIVKNGSVYGTGKNNLGQLGVGDWSNRTTFTYSGVSAISISSGWEHTIALQDDGTIYVTGRNDDGRLATSGTSSTNYSFVAPTATKNVKQVICGIYHTLLLKNDNTLWACGTNNYGQFGTTYSYSSPTQVASDIAEVYCGYGSTFVVKLDGSLWVCGRNVEGQLGLGDTTNKTSFVKIADSTDDIKQLIASYCNMFILKNDGSLLGAGRGDYGTLGVGDNEQKNTFITLYEPAEYDPTEGMTVDETRHFKLHNFLSNHGYDVSFDMTTEEMLDMLSISGSQRTKLYSLMLRSGYNVNKYMTLEELFDLL